MTVLYDIPEMEKTAVALGLFDGLHLGHMAVIEAAKKDNDSILTVFSIGKPKNADKYDAVGQSVESRLITEADEYDILSKAGVEYVIKPPFELLRSMPAQKFFSDILAKRLGAVSVSCGYNFRFGRMAAGSANELRRLSQRHGIECSVVDEVALNGEAVSSTRIRAMLSAGEVLKASCMLGRRYGYTLTVTHGRKLGRTLGAPTINQQLPATLYLPRFGVYSSETYIDGRWMYSVTNIGVKPTIGATLPLSETWIPEYSGDLYDQRIRVELTGFIRDERHFDSLEQLKVAIHNDAEAAKRQTYSI